MFLRHLHRLPHHGNTHRRTPGSHSLVTDLFVPGSHTAGCRSPQRDARPGIDAGILQLIAGATACANVLTSSAAELHDELTTIYDGTLVDDDLDTGVLTVSSASAHGMSVTAQSPTRTSPLS
ncbi:hypothetical protein [Streptomyces sp. NBC_01518]|uniref:hypothetical protein n=1 Tax=Streptomyces sp. NBC_01518 TaxID=2903891 RepID=UPI003869B013